MEQQVINKHRYRQLDSLRGIAALTVFLGHFMGVKVNMPLYQKLYPLPVSVLFNGNAAVIFFFVLSGFVLSLPYIDNQRHLNLMSFYIKRVFRIFPAFIFALVFALLLKQFLFDKSGMSQFSGWIKSFWTWDWNKTNVTEFLKTLLLIGPQFKKYLIDPVIWSLVVEVNISLFLPFFIRIVSRNGIAVNLLLLIVATACTCRGDYWSFPVFYLGVLLARYRHQLIFITRRWSRVYVIFALLLALFLYNNFYEFLNAYNQFTWPYKLIWCNYLVAIGSCIVIVLVLADKKATMFFEHRAFTFLGDISYSFYLIHLPLLLTVSSLFSFHSGLSLVYIFIFTLASAIPISYVMFIYVEKPFIKAGSKVAEWWLNIILKRFTYFASQQ